MTIKIGTLEYDSDGMWKKIKKLVNIFKDDISQKCDSTPIVTLHIRDQTCSEANFTIACDNLDLAVEYDVKKDVNIDVSGIKCRLDAETPEFKMEDIGGVLLNVPKKFSEHLENDKKGKTQDSDKLTHGKICIAAITQLYKYFKSICSSDGWTSC